MHSRTQKPCISAQTRRECLHQEDGRPEPVLPRRRDGTWGSLSEQWCAQFAPMPQLRLEGGKFAQDRLFASQVRECPSRAARGRAARCHTRPGRMWNAPSLSRASRAIGIHELEGHGGPGAKPPAAMLGRSNHAGSTQRGENCLCVKFQLQTIQSKKVMVILSSPLLVFEK